MNVSITGSGKISEGEYTDIKIGGCGKLIGEVTCAHLSCSGKASGDKLICSGSVDISGSASFKESVKTQTLDVCGKFICNGSLEAEHSIKARGYIECGGSIICDNLTISGALKSGCDVTVKSADISGSVTCEKIVSEGEITITFDGSISADNIRGGRITVTPSKTKKLLKRFPLVRTMVKNAAVSSIEGDTVDIEHTDCLQVIGNNVSIGKGCCVALVQYRESFTVTKGAKVDKYEKI